MVAFPPHSHVFVQWNFCMLPFDLPDAYNYFVNVLLIENIKCKTSFRKGLTNKITPIVAYVLSYLHLGHIKITH